MNLRNVNRRLLIAILAVSIFLPTLPIAFAQPIPSNCSTVGLGISVSEDVAKAHVGDAIRHNVTISLPASTDCAVSNITINFRHPDGELHIIDGGITLGMNDTDPRSKTFVTDPYIVRQVDVVGGFVTATASANGTSHFDFAPQNVTASNSISALVIHPNISLTKTPSQSKVESGTNVTYTYNVTNTGDTTLSNVGITDNVFGNITSGQTLTAGQTATFTKSETLTADTTNTATATGTDQLGTTVSNTTSPVNVRVIHPNISLTKIASPTSGTAPLNVTYTYTVKNTGDATLSNVIITDNVFGAVGGPITLNPGVSQTFTKIATITNDTTNIATATGTDQFGANVTATATARVVIVPQAVGRMTGGGSVFNSTLRVTHGFELHCNASKPPNNLEVNWEGNRFHLENLTSATCIDDPAIRPNPPVAPFDTYIGAGIGNYNGVPGATAKWIFTDAGEPGTKDHANIQIFDANGNLVLSVSNFLDKGNQQAHAGDP